MSSPYYKGLIYTGRVRAANSKAENTTPASYDVLIKSSSPYYKGLTDQALLTIPNRERQSTTVSSSSSKTSFSDKIQERSADCFKSRHPLSPHSRPSSLPSPAKRAVINAKETREPMEEKNSWADKYRPANLDNFISKKDKAIELLQKKSDESCPPFISEGVTKPRMICEPVSEAFGPDKIQAHDKRKKFKMKVTPFVCSELDKDIVVAIKMGASFGFKPSFSSDCVDELKRQHGYLSSINELVFVSFRLPKKGWTCILSGDEFKRWRMSTWLFFRVTWLGFSSLKFCVVGCGLAGGFVLSSDWDACSYPFELCFRRRQVYLEGVILCSDGGLEARNHCSLTQ
ncbi:hypothetical protein Tco_1211660 [Tanacetum coccineum]